MSGTTTCTNLSVQPDPLVHGGKATVTVTNGPPNSIVTVDVEDGRTPPDSEKIDVHTDGSGHGTTIWEVPNWDLAIFSLDGCEVVRAIV